MVSETVEVKVRLPEKVHTLLSWYVRLTSDWSSNEQEKEAFISYGSPLRSGATTTDPGVSTVD